MEASQDTVERSDALLENELQEATWDALAAELDVDAARLSAGQEKGAKFPTSKARISVDFHSFRLIFGRVSISRNNLEA